VSCLRVCETQEEIMSGSARRTAAPFSLHRGWRQRHFRRIRPRTQHFGASHLQCDLQLRGAPRCQRLQCPDLPILCVESPAARTCDQVAQVRPCLSETLPQVPSFLVGSRARCRSESGSFRPPLFHGQGEVLASTFRSWLCVRSPRWCARY
jgi:hypothetical protein